MAEKHKAGKDDLLKDGVSFYPADQHDLDTYAAARQQLAEFKVPVLIRAGNPNERLFVASFDGTGNDGYNDPEHATHVSRIEEELRRAAVRARTEGREPQVVTGYIAGPGTQQNPVSNFIDKAVGHTYEERIENMYKQFIEQAHRWKTQNPDIQIRLLDMGFSRGGEEAVGFSRLVHDRGIQDPTGAVYKYDSAGQIKSVRYTRPPLVAPGETPQAAMLFDPVGTGEPVWKHDRRLPASVISVLQLTAEDERRSLFKSTPATDLGLSEDGRALNMMVGGCHSDLVGSYHRNGLGVLAGHVATDYINALSDRPILAKQAVPDDPRLFVVHRSEEGMLLYRLTPKVDRTTSEGRNDRLVPKDQLEHVADGYNPEPRDEALASQFEFRKVPLNPAPKAPEAAQRHDDPATVVDRLLAAATAGDTAAFRDATRSAADHDAARALRQHAVTTVDQQQLAASQQQATQQQDAQQQEAHARRQTVPMH